MDKLDLESNATTAQPQQYPFNSYQSIYLLLEIMAFNHDALSEVVAEVIRDLFNGTTYRHDSAPLKPWGAG